MISFPERNCDPVHEQVLVVMRSLSCARFYWLPVHSKLRYFFTGKLVCVRRRERNVRFETDELPWTLVSEKWIAENERVLRKGGKGHIRVAMNGRRVS